MVEVSVVIPTYNRANYLPQAVQSVLDQSFKDFEVVIIDDGSTDNTNEVITRFRDSRLCYVYQDNQGKGSAINHGIAISKGKYILKLDSDDWLLPGAIANLASEFVRQPELAVVAGGYIVVDANGNEKSRVASWRDCPSIDLSTWLVKMPLLWQGALIKKEWLEKVNGYDPKITGPDDWDLGIRLAYEDCPMGWVEKYVFYYRLHGGMSIRHLSKQREEYIYILDKLFSMTDLPPDIVASKRAIYTQAYLNLAGREYGEGGYAEAQRDLNEAIQMCPEMLQKGCRSLYSVIAWWSRSRINSLNPFAFMRNVLAHLPESATKRCNSYRSAIAEYYAVELFQAREKSDCNVALKSSLQIMLNKPSRLLDREILKVITEAFISPFLIDILITVAHKILRREST